MLSGVADGMLVLKRWVIVACILFWLPGAADVGSSSIVFVVMFSDIPSQVPGQLVANVLVYIIPSICAEVVSRKRRWEPPQKWWREMLSKLANVLVPFLPAFVECRTSPENFCIAMTLHDKTLSDRMHQKTAKQHLKGENHANFSFR